MQIRRYVWGAWLGVALLSGLETYAFRGLAHHPASLVVCLAARMPPWLVWAIATPGLVRLPRPWPPRPRVLAIHAGAFAAIVLAFATVYAALDIATGLAPDLELGFGPRVLQSALGWSSVLVVAYVGVQVLAIALAALAERRQSELTRAALATQLARAELAALTAQIHPHFLFNALNTVLAFVRTADLASAERAVILLGDILRDVLRKRELDEQPLRDEVGMLERYVELQQMRFPDRLRVRWDLDPEALATPVPALLLQPLVENAVRHGISARTASGAIRIAARRAGESLELEVEDDGPGLPRAFDLERCEGVGLRNTRARLAQRYGAEAELRLGSGAAGGLLVSLRLPAS